MWPEQIIPKIQTVEEFKIQKALNKRKAVYIEDFEDLLENVVFVFASKAKNGTLTIEHLIVVTILAANTSILLSTIVCPRNFVIISKNQTGIHEDQLRNQMDEIEAKNEIQKIVRGKVIIGFEIAEMMEITRVPSDSIKGYIDISILPILLKEFHANKKKVRIKNITNIL